MPEHGQAVEFEIECEWNPPVSEWTEQELQVIPPWGGDPLRLTVLAGCHQLQGLLTRSANDISRLVTGIYSLQVERPYDPQQFGLHGYPPDLGIVAKRIIIRIEPAHPSVSD